MGIEREVTWTGIGGQGVQLAAKILALAAIREGREVMSLGTYGGTMRGGNTDATIVIADQSIVQPPIVSKAWAAVIVHPRYYEPLRAKVRSGGLVLADEDLLEEPLKESVGTHHLISATKLAREVEAPKAGALVLLGAFASLTGMVSLDSLGAALADALPPYRHNTLPSNQRALEAGAGAVSPLGQPAWVADEKGGGA